MGLFNILLIVFAFGGTKCLEDFMTVGKSSILIVEEKLPFFEAEKSCKAMDSNLVEFWTEDEWNEVIY